MSFVAHRLAVDVELIIERIRQVEAGTGEAGAIDDIRRAIESIQGFIATEQRTHSADRPERTFDPPTARPN